MSLRGRDLRLLALRGRFALDNTPLSELTLAEGQRIFFARDLALTVVEVVLPDEVLALEAEGHPQRLLTGVTSLWGPPLSMGAGYREGAEVLIWNKDDRWRLQRAGESPRDLGADDVFEVSGQPVRVVSVRLSAVARPATRLQGAIDGPLRIEAQYDSVHLHREGEPVLALSGIPARILAELVAFGAPVEWEVLAGEIWPHVSDRHRLRRSLDVSLGRLRRKLEQGRVRSDLVRSDGTGKIELVLAQGDEAVDLG